MLSATVAARLRALLRRAIQWGDVVPGSPLALDEACFEACWNAVRRELTPVEFRLLLVLAKH